MRKVMVIIYLLVINLFLPSISVSKSGVSSSPIVCGVDSKNFISHDLAKHSPANKIFDVLVIAFNDAQCVAPEYMANFAIIVVELPGNYYYNISHVHFSKEGSFISGAFLLDWKLLRNLDDPYIIEQWCGFVKSVYPEELKKFECI